MRRRTFMRLAGGGVVLAAGAYGSWRQAERSLFAVPPSAVAAWSAAGQEAEPRRFVLSHAILAPNPHNMQPWIAELGTPGEIAVSLDTERLLPETDPYGRQILMGLGCFLELLSLAAAAHGHRADIALFPDGEPGATLDARRVALVRLLEDPGAMPDPLFAAALDRRTDRRAYDPASPVTPDEIAALERATSSLPVTFAVETRADRVEAIRAIAGRAWRIELTTEGPMMESIRVLRVGTREIDRHRDGLVIDEPLLVMLERLGLLDRSTMPAPDSPGVRAQIDGFDATASTPAYLTIVTQGNGRSRQVAAGRAYLRASLAGTALGLAMHPNQQSLQEYPEMAEAYRAIHDLLGAPAPRFTVQMLARLGHLPAGAQALRPAPRRGLDAQLAGA